MEQSGLRIIFEQWCRKLRIVPDWDVRLSMVDDPKWEKTGDLKVDCDAKEAVFLLNIANPRKENLEHVIVHELMHLKMYPLDQMTETLIVSNFEEDTPGYRLAYNQFFTALEQTVDELSKCFLFEFGDDRELTFGRCGGKRSFTELYEGLKNLE